MSETKYVDTNIAGYILGISAGRIRKLLGDRRIEGAFKITGFWRIPLYDGKPKVKRALMRHRKGSWDTEQQNTKGIMIHAWKQRIQVNHHPGELYKMSVTEDSIVFKKIQKPLTTDELSQGIEEVGPDPDRLTMEEICEILKEVRREMKSKE